MRILIVDQCSGRKDIPSSFDEPYDEADIDSSSLDELREREGVPTQRARQLYQGRQQTYVSKAVDALREAGDTVERIFISAGFGVVDEEALLPPYDVTFADMTASEIQNRAENLEIQAGVKQRLEASPPFDIVFLALGSDYYRSLDLEAVLGSLPESTVGVVFNQEEVASGFENVISIPARNREAKEHGTIVVALKGRYLQNFAEHRANDVTVEGPDDVFEYCTTEYTTQAGFGEYDS